MCLASLGPFKGRQLKKEKEREKEKTKDAPKGPEEHSLVMDKLKVLNGGKKKTQFRGPMERQARRACQKARVVFALTSPIRGAGKDFHQNKGRKKDHKGKGKEGTFPQSGLSA